MTPVLPTPAPIRVSEPGSAAQTIRPVVAQPEQRQEKREAPPQAKTPQDVGRIEFQDSKRSRAAGRVDERSRGNLDDSLDFHVPTDPPGLEMMTRRYSEAAFLEQLVLQKQAKDGGQKMMLPEEPEVFKERYQGRPMPRMTVTVEPAYFCHGRMFFEQPNLERHGWDLGVLTPAVSAGVFFYDTLLLPYHAFSRPFQSYDCSAGRCLPGDPTPFLLYRERFSVTGLVGQAAAITGGIFTFP